jgi:hypothetical protein
MVLTEVEKKARREAGRRKELESMSPAKQVQRSLTGGRPPLSELRTPNAARTAARTLQREIRSRFEAETNGTRPRAASDYFGVTVAYVSADLSVLGITPIYSPLYAEDETAADKELGDQIERALTGNIALGLIFGIANGEDILVGTRLFLVTKQSEGWLDELTLAAQGEMSLDKQEKFERGFGSKGRKKS